MTEHQPSEGPDATEATEPALEVQRGPDAPSEPAFPAGRYTLGVLLVLIGVAALVESAGWARVPWEALLPALLILIGLGMIAGARGGRHRGLYVFGIVLTVLLALGVTARVSFGGGVGELIVSVTSAADLQDTYERGIGRVELDLRDLDLPAGVTNVRVRLGVGEAVVLLPRTGEAFVDARISLGSIQTPEESADGLDQRLTYQTQGFGTATTAISIDIRVNIGSIEVRAS